MATPQPSFQLGILPERKIDRRALAASYGFVVLVTFLLVNLGLLFPDRLQLKAYRVTELIPMPALEARAGTGQGEAVEVEDEAASSATGFRATEAGGSA